jgi:hypothetical protein
MRPPNAPTRCPPHPPAPAGAAWAPPAYHPPPVCARRGGGAAAPTPPGTAAAAYAASAAGAAPDGAGGFDAASVLPVAPSAIAARLNRASLEIAPPPPVQPPPAPLAVTHSSAFLRQRLAVRRPGRARGRTRGGGPEGRLLPCSSGSTAALRQRQRQHHCPVAAASGPSASPLRRPWRPPCTPSSTPPPADQITLHPGVTQQLPGSAARTATPPADNALAWALRKFDQQLDQIEADPPAIVQASYDLAHSPLGEAAGAAARLGARAALAAATKAAEAAAPVGAWVLREGAKAAGKAAVGVAARALDGGQRRGKPGSGGGGGGGSTSRAALPPPADAAAAAATEADAADADVVEAAAAAADPEEGRAGGDGSGSGARWPLVAPARACPRVTDRDREVWPNFWPLRRCPAAVPWWAPLVKYPQDSHPPPGQQRL